jgi:hypothetical protein
MDLKSSKWVSWGKQEIIDDYYKWFPQRVESAEDQGLKFLK